jgi:LytS/YehU family sensor histidine kinase
MLLLLAAGYALPARAACTAQVSNVALIGPNKTNLTVSPAAADAVVPRLVLQPLLENVFKHGVACHSGLTAVGLSVRKRGRRLAVTLWNDIERPAQPIASCRGLDLVRRRLTSAGGELAISGNGERRFIVRALMNDD